MVLELSLVGELKFDSQPPQYSHNLLWTVKANNAPKMGNGVPLFDPSMGFRVGRGVFRLSREQFNIRRRDQPSGATPICATPSVSFAAKWGDEEHDLFVRLCYGQVVKGNRPNTTLNKEGWNVVYQQLTSRSGKDPVWDLRKLKNHWDPD
ncbi:hypothetical protein AgCh_034439 [Apium graveolens]